MRKQIHYGLPIFCLILQTLSGCGGRCIYDTISAPYPLNYKGGEVSVNNEKINLEMPEFSMSIYLSKTLISTHIREFTIVAMPMESRNRLVPDTIVDTDFSITITPKTKGLTFNPLNIALAINDDNGMVPSKTYYFDGSNKTEISGEINVSEETNFLVVFNQKWNPANKYVLTIKGLKNETQDLEIPVVAFKDKQKKDRCTKGF